ncbi:tubulin-tyrosine ligase family protein (macronuclear) [Tetrahymena thermophila SB210]|uniref:Tubulin-tyrosine ligase family protein n=1 Tax=Tetrahymena thermophila (strain SB210) TaxID=312017 RepID=W7X914_TETTS|nr:tubulin-tyrosine ligase family protein [Tetrahymena thermophila SB210]EWS72878.1 tubulin-tyrosine ligase family protein [Tetrahymena thermophila SB210]|eukprot:XP_012654585.1 tubulin-tyrosine ligase family protein [Tetrahymena thermophila SB210]
MILLFVILNSILLVHSQRWIQMQEKCLNLSSCQLNLGCQAQVQHCTEGCSVYIHRKDYYECFVECANIDFKDNILQETQEYMECLTQIIKKLQLKTEQQTNQLSVIQRKKQYEQDQYTHTGETFKILNCQKYVDYPELRKKVIIKQGIKQKMIFKYFESRCDFYIQVLDDILTNDSSFYFKWTDYAHQQNYTIFQAGNQIVNHIPNSRNLLSDKNRFILTMENFDKFKDNPYKVRSHQIHFKTYLFHIDEEVYSPQELEFFNTIEGGYWLAKDPYGSLGKGIQLFRGTQEIKEKIKFYKSNKQELLNDLQIKENRPYISMFQVIQKYLENPFLIDGRKFDIRSYVLIASVEPFVVLYQSGFIKKCIKEYDLNFEEFNEDESMKHLTNRSFQKNHENYKQEAENLMMSIEQYETYLKSKEHFTQDQIQFLWNKAKKTVSYSLLAAKKQLGKKRGYFQLLGIDLIFDANFNAYIIEYNTSAGLFMELSTHHLVIPQLLQTTLDLILDSHRQNVDLNKYWKNPNQSDLGKWEILYNEASGFDFLLDFEKVEEQLDSQLFKQRRYQQQQTDL